MLIPCPMCGLRAATEFRFVDEHRPRPSAATAGPGHWRDYLYLRANPAGAAVELWLHRMGCRQYLVVARDTVHNTVTQVRLAREVVDP